MVAEVAAHLAYVELAPAARVRVRVAERACAGGRVHVNVQRGRLVDALRAQVLSPTKPTLGDDGDTAST